MLRKSLLVFVILACSLSALNAAVLGGSRGLTGTEFQNAVGKLYVTLNKIAALNGPAYTVFDVNHVTQQVVEGLITRYFAVLSNNNVPKYCNVELWERSWLPKGIDVKIYCNGVQEYGIQYDP